MHQENKLGGSGCGHGKKWWQHAGILLLCLLLGYTNAKAQYGNGSDGTWTVSGTQYTDDVRAQVTGFSSATQLTTHGTWWYGNFLVGDLVMVIQMIPGSLNSGFYATATVTAVAPGTITLNSPIGGSFTFTAPQVVQIIKVKQHTTITVQNNAVVTCHAWDGHTGGVACVMASVKLEFSPVSGPGNVSGKFDVSGKGYFEPTTLAGGAGGTGGTGLPGPTTVGLGGTVINGNGGTAGAGTGWMGAFAPAICPTALTGGHGGNGGGANVYGNPGGTGGIATNYGMADYNYAPYKKLIMGSAGNGGSGGYGGGSGGAGGGGGASNINPGNPGSLPPSNGDGGTGGDGGNGGIGGGALYIRAVIIETNNNGGKLFVTRGGIGSPGYPGTGDLIKGRAGDGGNGGQGSCVNGVPNSSGGGGGAGYRGNGAWGGNGGNDGAAGPMWLIYKTSHNVVLAQVDKGPGSTQAAGGTGARPYPTVATNGSTPTFCLTGCNYLTPYAYCAITRNDTICDCWEAHCLLSKMTSATEVANKITFTGPGGISAVYDKNVSPRMLYAIEPKTIAGTCSTHAVNNNTVYKCPASPNGDCDALYNILKNSPTMAGTCGTKPNNIVFGTTGVTYTESTDPDKLFNNLYNCTTSCSDQCTGDCPQKGFDGTSGTPGAEGPFELVQEGEGTFLKHDITGIEQANTQEQQFTLSPNPAHSQLTVSFTANTPQQYNFTISNVAGKKLYTETYSAQAGKNTYTIPLRKLAPGSYVLNITAKGTEKTIKFIVE